jgi:poly(hydroxyalkanoate) granule-associated protein
MKKQQPTLSIIESAHQIWLAGLGAFAKAEAEGGKFFEALIREGQKVELRTRKVAEHKVEEVKDKVREVKEKASDTLESVEQGVEDRITRVLLRLGVPTNDDVRQLIRSVEQLSANIRALKKD